MRDLISIDQISVHEINEIHSQAERFFQNPARRYSDLEGKLLVTCFFENSTRTRMSFEIAAKRMGAKVLNLDISTSSIKKNESVIDTIKTINAMRPDFIAVRHDASGIVRLLKSYARVPLINAGDGTNEHPTQALLDSFVIRQHKKSLKGLRIAICGDVLHSRVARSNIKLLTKFDCKINIITPSTLMPLDYKVWLKERYNADVFQSLEEGIENVDVIIMLRIQQERMLGCYIPSLEEYFKVFGLTHEKMKSSPKALVLHPGPVNCDIEISSVLANDKKVSLILEQVEAGVAIRQSIFRLLSVG